MFLDDDVTDDAATRCQGDGVDRRVHEYTLLRVIVVQVWLPVTVDAKKRTTGGLVSEKGNGIAELLVARLSYLSCCFWLFVPTF